MTERNFFILYVTLQAEIRKGVLKQTVTTFKDIKQQDDNSAGPGILDAFSADFQRIEEVLEQHFSSHIPFVNEISRHILFANGKRIRPLLTVCSARLCGLDADYAFDLSAVPEYLHAASLLHDDVVDSGEMRRGVPPAYKVWGNSAAVLVGDYMYARAIGLASQFGDVRIAAEIADTVGLMAEGEIIQLLHAKRPSFDEKTYSDIIYRKTAALISTSCRIGALLAGASKEQEEAVSTYGLNLGKAFQLIDDVLDYTADASELGKAIGTDLAEGKLTLPIVIAVKKADSSDSERLLSIMGHGHPSSEDMKWVKNLLNETGAIDYTRDKAGALVKAACDSLDIFEKTSTRELLKALALFVLERRK